MTRWFKVWIATPEGLRMYFMPLERYEGIFNTLVQEYNCDIIADGVKLKTIPDIPVTWIAHPATEDEKKGHWKLDDSKTL